jgi:hypothetical protein
MYTAGAAFSEPLYFNDALSWCAAGSVYPNPDLASDGSITPCGSLTSKHQSRGEAVLGRQRRLPPH